MSQRSRRPLIAGNWKMNGLAGSVGEVQAMIGGGQPAPADAVDLLVCPPATLTRLFADVAAGTPIRIGGQDCHPQVSGAHTGDISAEMLADAGATAVIVGHSERRVDHGETDALVRAKAEAGLRAGLTVIVCVGESRAEREAGRAIDVVEGQLDGSVPADAPTDRLVIAYEPVWAIGTGLTPTREDVAEMHGAIRKRLADWFGQEAAERIRILYGGSVKPQNAAELLSAADVDGALVGGASLKAADFLGIARAAA